MIIKGSDLNDIEVKNQLVREIKSLIEAKYSSKEVYRGTFQVQFKVNEVSPYL